MSNVNKQKLDEYYDNQDLHKEFLEAVLPAINYIKKYGNPHSRIIIDCNEAEFLSGELCTGKLYK